MLEVVLYNSEGQPSEPVQVEFVSLVSPETYGPPALVAPPRGGPAKAEVGETVMYLPTGPGAPPFTIKRIADR